MKKIFFLIVTGLMVGCSFDVSPKLSTQDLVSVVVERYQDDGQQVDIPWERIPPSVQGLLCQWISASPLDGRMDFATYAPKIVLRAKRFNVNFTGDRAVCNFEEKSGRWVQCSRVMNGLDREIWCWASSGLQAVEH